MNESGGLPDVEDGGYSPCDFPVTRHCGEHPPSSLRDRWELWCDSSRIGLLATLLACLAGLITKDKVLFDRPLWHDEAQVAFGAGEWLRNDERRFCDGSRVVGENLHHELNNEGDLPLMSPMENWLAALGWTFMEETTVEPWSAARWPFFLCGIITLGVMAWGVGRAVGSMSMVLLGALVWGMNPWVWSLSVQLRYYPVVWLLVSLGMTMIFSVGAHRNAPLSRSTIGHAILLLLLYLTNWVVALCWIPVAVVMQALADKRRLSPMCAGFGVALGLMALHASLGSDLASWALMLPDRASAALKVFVWHASEFNLDVFPLSLLALMVVTGWKKKELRSLLVGSCLVAMLLFIPSFYTRLALMFLPLFAFTLALWLWHLSERRPATAMVVGTLALGSYFFQVAPCALASKMSERAKRWCLPLTREPSRMVTNTREAWGAITDPWPCTEGRLGIGACLNDVAEDKRWAHYDAPLRKNYDYMWPLDALALWLSSHVKKDEQVICAMDGTALEMMTGLTFNWRVPAWGQGRGYAENLMSPEGVRYVVLRTQHPFLTREVTWTNEILMGLEKGWLKGQPVTLPFEDVKYFNSPFPFAMHRQTWPKVESLRVMVLDHPVTREEAARLLPIRDRRLIRPEGVDLSMDPDEVWGYPLR